MANAKTTARSRLPFRDFLEPAAVFVAIALGAVVLFLRSPTDLDFGWSDAPRHALDGAFIRDFFATLPLRDPYRWAVAYYDQYPALTIGLYPPVFYFVEAAFFAVFGTTHAVAQACVACFTMLLGIAAYLLARVVLPRWPSLGVALLSMGVPEMAYWGRQVMLDIPALALLVLGFWCFIRFLRRDRGWDLTAAVALLLASIYTKYNMALIVPALAAPLLGARGLRGFVDRRVLVAGGAGIVGLLPALVVNTFFVRTNLESVTGRPDDLPLSSLGAWLFYPKMLPEQLGIITGILLLVGIVLWALRTPRLGPGWFHLFLLCWLVLGYLASSAIAVREPRHDLVLLLSLILAAACGYGSVLPPRPYGFAAVAAGFLVLGYSAFAYRPASVSGYRQAVDYVAANAPPNSAVIVSAYRDGNITFGLRTHEERRDLQIVRVDKLLLQVSIERERGVTENALSEEDIRRILRERRAGLIVAQAGFWDDLAAMQRFEHVLHSADFEQVATFPLAGELSTNESPDVAGGPRLEIFRPARSASAQAN